MATQTLTATTAATESVSLGRTTCVDAQGSAAQQLGSSSAIMDGPSGAPRAHDPRDAMNLRDNRDLYSSHHRPPMQPMMQPQYAPASRAPEPPPPQTMSGYRYPSTPGPRGDPRDTVPARSFTPVGTYDPRGAYPPPDMRDVQLREQHAHAQMREHQAQQQQHQQMREQHQQSILQQHLRPQDRPVYDSRPLHPPDRYGR